MNWWLRQAAQRVPRRAFAAIAVVLELALTRALGAADITAPPTHGTGPWCEDCGKALR